MQSGANDWLEVAVDVDPEEEGRAVADLATLFPQGLRVEAVVGVSGGDRVRLIGYRLDSARESLHSPEVWRRRIQEELGSVVAQAVRVRRIADQDWLGEWRRNWRPVEVCPGIWVRAPWHQPPAEGRSICLEPGMAFGTGHHESTRLAAGFLAPRVSAKGRYYDLGCGTGVLAMVALLQGAARVDLYDIDPTAREVALREIERNGLLSGVRWVEHSPRAPGDGYDGVFLNITADVVCAVLPELTPLLRRGGWVATSGILREQAEAVGEAAAAAGLRLSEEAVEGEWWGGVLERG
jgi:ribosomal protein L11 methyltransferase